AATGSFGVKGVNRSSLEGGDCILDKDAFVQRVRVDKNLDIHVIRHREGAIDGGRGRTPVFMKLEAACTGLDLLNEARWRACVSFAEKAEVDGKPIGCLQHLLNVPRTWSTGRCIRPYCRSCPTTHHCGQA